LEATGRSGAYTTLQLKELVKTLSETPGVSRDAAEAIVGEFARAGQISTALGERLSHLVADFALATGQKIPDAAKALADAFSDPARGVETLEKALGRLKPNDISRIKDALDLGDVPRAQTILVEGLENAIKGLSDRAITPLQDSTNNLGNAWNRLMHSLDESPGLKRANELLATMINAVAWLIDHADKIQFPTFNGLGLPNATIPQALIGTAEFGFNKVKNALSSNTGGATGSFDLPGGATGSFGESTKKPALGVVARVVGSNEQSKLDDDEIKRAVKLGEQYKAVGDQIDKLRDKRAVLVAALKKVPLTDTFVRKDLKEGIAGIDEKIKTLGKRGGRDAERIDDAKLKDRINAIQDALTKQTEGFTVQEQLLQTAYSLGESSLKKFFDNKIDIIRQKTAAQTLALDEQIAATQDRLAKTKDPVKKEQLEDRIKDLNREKDLVENRGSNALTVANDQARTSFDQLQQQVNSYRAELKRLQGDELGAADIEAELTIKRAKILAKNASDDPRLPNVDVAAQQSALDIQRRLLVTREQSAIIDSRLSIQESAIQRAMRIGVIDELDGLSQLGAARQKAVADLEEVVKAKEAVAKEQPWNYQLQIDTAQARDALENLKAEMDPLKDKFDNIFKGATENFLNDIMGGKKDAFKTLFNNIGRELNSVVAKSITTDLFAPGKGVGNSVSDFFKKLFTGDKTSVSGLFGSKSSATKPEADVASAGSSATSSLTNLTSVGLDPATQALQRFSNAVDTASDSLNNRPTNTDISSPGFTNSFDDGSMSKVLGTGEQSVMEMFRDASKESNRFADTSASAADNVLSLARAATKGSDALALLPRIISLIESLSATKSGGSNLIGAGLSALGSGGSSYSQLSEGISFMSDFFDTGGYTGGDDPRKPAGIVHGKEFVFSAAATSRIGRSTLEKVHNKAKAGDPNALSSSAERKHMYMVGGMVKDDWNWGNMAGYYEGGYVQSGSDWPGRMLHPSVNPRILMADRKSDDQGNQSHHRGGDVILHVNVTPPAGASRQTAMQWGATAGRHISASLKRNGQ
jgi:hypothetical protein